MGMKKRRMRFHGDAEEELGLICIIRRRIFHGYAEEGMGERGGGVWSANIFGMFTLSSW